MTHQPHHPDALIDRALQSLRDAQAPTGLDSRIAARIARVAETHAITSSRLTTSLPFAITASRTSAFADKSSRLPFFAVILNVVKDPRILLAQVPIYALAAAALLIASFFAFHHHQNSMTVANSNPQPLALPNQPTKSVQTSSIATTQVPQGFSLGSHRPTQRTGASAPAPTDPDAIALAETQAPSRPAPPMPLTPQEQLLIAATRRGQPIELAELDLLRAPALRSAAEARERSNLRQFAQGLLGPLAAAEALNPDPPPNP